MARCKFCAKKLNTDGYCANAACPENTRREIVEGTATTSETSTTTTSTT